MQPACLVIPVFWLCTMSVMFDDLYDLILRRIWSIDLMMALVSCVLWHLDTFWTAAFDFGSSRGLYSTWDLYNI